MAKYLRILKERVNEQYGRKPEDGWLILARPDYDRDDLNFPALIYKPRYGPEAAMSEVPLQQFLKFFYNTTWVHVDGEIELDNPIMPFPGRHIRISREETRKRLEQIRAEEAAKAAGQ